MRVQLLSLLLLSSCTILFPALAPESCEEGTPALCAGDTLLSCFEGFEVETQCDPGRCDAQNSRCDVCGDAQLDPTEACDDGNTVAGDGCSATCEVEPFCGDGLLTAPEICDDGANNSDTAPDACRTNCHPASCGDNVVDTGEGCDDGNVENSDGCSAVCQTEGVCGDGTVNAGEQCDDGASNSDTTADACRTDCSLASCGDNVTDSGEQCDDGASNSDTNPDACRTSCTFSSCGDGVVDTGEDCEPPGQGVCDANCQNPCSQNSDCDDNDACTNEVCNNSACEFSPIAGIVDGDACTQDVCDPTSGAISHPPIVGINDNNQCTDDSCSGGTITNAPVTNGTPCGGAGFICLSASCGASVCGDNFIDTASGEACDDGNTANGDGCSATCQAEGDCGGSPAGSANFDDTTGGPNLSAGSCTGQNFPERVFLFTPPGNTNEFGTLDLTLISDTDQGIYVRTQCDDAATELDCIDDEFGGTPEFLTINNVQAGAPLAIIVDVFHDVGGNFPDGLPGPFSLFVEFSMCGNNVVNSGEVCDDGNRTDGDGCRGDCKSNETCGNGVFDFSEGEECDDGNTANGDGCSSVCGVEAAAVCADVLALSGVNIGDTRETSSAIGGGCFGPDGPESVFEFTPPSNGVLSLRLDSISEAVIYVRATCPGVNDIACVDAADVVSSEFLDVNAQSGVPLFVFVDAHFGEASPFVLLASFEACGNNSVGGPEQCDDGNNVGGDGCSADCLSSEQCGNGVIDAVNGEACDDGNTTNGDGCESNCQFICGGATNPDVAIVDPGTNHCYVGFDDFQTWNAAQSICSGFGGSLAVLNSAAENNLIAAFTSVDFWIGLNDQAVEGTFVWVNAEAVNFTGFATGQPNNNGDQDCVIATVDGWFDEACGDTFRYACELP